MGRDFIMGSYSAVQRSVDIEDSRNAADSRQNAILFGNDGRGGPLIGVNAGIAGRIAGGAVLQQGILDNGGRASRIPIHRCVGTGALTCPAERSSAEFSIRSARSVLWRAALLILPTAYAIPQR